MKLIDLDALGVGMANPAVFENRAHADGWNSLFSILQKAPAVYAVPMVRCKDCKHFCPYVGEEYKGDCMELIGLESCVYEDDYCSHWEKRDGGAEK